MATTPKPTEKKKSADRLHPFLEILRSPVTLGLILTLIFTLIAINFYSVRGQQESLRHTLPIWKRTLFEAAEKFDLLNQDLRFRMRGVRKPSAPVALLTIDDRSVEEIGRWPWSREKIAFVIEEMMKYKAKAVGFDIVFSEAQTDPTLEAIQRIEDKTKGVKSDPLRSALAIEKAKGQPDSILAATIAKYRDKLVLGAFNEESDDSRLSAYQDYCRNEAFKRANAEKFVKNTNTTFIVNDEADLFVDLEFDKVFDQLFPAIEKDNTELALKQVFNKKSVQELSEVEKRKLLFLLQSANMKYCESWLTPNDLWIKDTLKDYGKIFQKSKDLKDLPVDAAIEKFKALSKPMPILQHQRWTINTDQVQAGGDYTGSFNANQDSDGTIRKAHLFFRTGNRLGTSFIPSIALQTFLLATGYRADVEINQDPKHPEQKTLTKFMIVNPSKDPEEAVGPVPIDPQGRVNINYAGGRNMFVYLPAKELFNGKETAIVSQAEWNPETSEWNQKDFEVQKADFIKGKAFIFGATAIGIYDLRVTPFDKNFPGPETHLNTLANLMEQNFLKNYEAESQYMAAALLVFGVLLSIAIAWTGAIAGFILTLASVGAVIFLDQFFLKKGYLVSMTLPAGLILFLYIFLFFYKYLTEERKKKHLRSTFSKYVSPAIVDEILKHPGNVELGGKKQRMTVFFSDVRGFTTISEKLDPQALGDVLTKYLTPMTQIVFANRGTLDKYMGDALMAFFGAPISYPDHAKAACRCALQSLVKLAQLQKEFKAQDLPLIDIGIGINTGDMSVGNMGSDIVRSYTVMGDSVNLASRLEGINKEYGTRITISQFTFDEVKDSFTGRELDWVRVKGKYEPVRIYELICEGQANPEKQKMLDAFSQGFQLYHEKNFQTALASFQTALTLSPEDAPSQLYVERCGKYLKDPPDDNWDGVFVMKSK